MTESKSSESLLSASNLVSQGAEAKIYHSSLHGLPILLKHRFSKKYRHPALDASLTRSRLAAEARALLKCLRSGVHVPCIRMVDPSAGVLGLEWIDGKSVRRLIPASMDQGENDRSCNSLSSSENFQEMEALLEFRISLDALMELIGVEIAKMHQADVIHGDLTTSNMMLRHPSSFTSHLTNPLPTELVLIDFGLSYYSGISEDKAVDLYVLERAFSSTHPDSSRLFEKVLEAYGRETGPGWRAIAKKLDEVRMRGRKRTMVG